MDWYRAYHGTISDPKFAVIASRSGQPKVAVLAIWQALLEYASQCDERGSLEGVDFEVIAACLDVTQCNVTSVYDALCDKKLIAKNRIAAWEKRQIVRDDDSKERVRKHREKKRQQGLEADKPDSVTQCNADVTQCNAPEQIQNRTEQKRKEKKVSAVEDKSSSADTRQTAVRRPPPDFKKLTEVWNEATGSTVKTLNDTRKRRLAKALQQIEKHYGLEAAEAWQCYGQEIHQSDFLAGRQKDWKASIDWAIKPENVLKVLDGNYGNRPQEPPDKPPEIDGDLLKKQLAWKKNRGGILTENEEKMLRVFE